MLCKGRARGGSSAACLTTPGPAAAPPDPAGSELRVVGGGSNNKLWRRVVADAFQLPLRFPAEPEAAALGAALQAAAVHSGTPVADYVAAHPPPLGERRGTGQEGGGGGRGCRGNKGKVKPAEAGPKEDVPTDAPTQPECARGHGCWGAWEAVGSEGTHMCCPARNGQTNFYMLLALLHEPHATSAGTLSTPPPPALPAEPEALQPAHEAAEAYRRAFQRHQQWGSCLYGGSSCDL